VPPAPRNPRILNRAIAGDPRISWPLGGRFTHAPKRERKLHGAIDGEIGVGMGAGGYNKNCLLNDDACDDRRWHQRVAFGSYLGGGAAYHFSFFALYARGRVQPTVSDGLPATVWGTM
jgi:hypothetical protein